MLNHAWKQLWNEFLLRNHRRFNHRAIWPAGLSTKCEDKNIVYGMLNEELESNRTEMSLQHRQMLILDASSVEDVSHYWWSQNTKEWASYVSCTCCASDKSYNTTLPLNIHQRVWMKLPQAFLRCKGKAYLNHSQTYMRPSRRAETFCQSYGLRLFNSGALSRTKTCSRRLWTWNEMKLRLSRAAIKQCIAKHDHWRIWLPTFIRILFHICTVK